MTAPEKTSASARRCMYAATVGFARFRQLLGASPSSKPNAIPWGGAGSISMVKRYQASVTADRPRIVIASVELAVTLCGTNRRTPGYRNPPTQRARSSARWRRFSASGEVSYLSKKEATRATSPLLYAARNSSISAAGRDVVVETQE